MAVRQQRARTVQTWKPRDGDDCTVNSAQLMKILSGGRSLCLVNKRSTRYYLQQAVYRLEYSKIV